VPCEVTQVVQKVYHPREHDSSPFFKVVTSHFDTFEKIYPERFQDLCVDCLVKEFYKEIIGFDLNEDQVRDILSGAYELKMMKGISHKG